MPKLLVLVSGLPCSGKTTVAQIIAQNFDAPVLSMGDIVREEASRLGIDPGKVATLLRLREGRRAIARRLIEKLRNVDKDVVVIEGVRGPDEVAHLKEESGCDVLLVYVVASRPVREERFRRRARQDDVGLTTVNVRDLRESLYGILDLLTVADIVLVNDYETTRELEELVNSKVIPRIRDRLR